MRPIDADELLKRTILVRGEYDDSCPFPAVPVPCINGAPTVDVEPVRHGHWIAIGEQSAICSRCKSPLKSNGKDMTGNALIHKAVYNYCPNCGAKMDGGSDNENH